MQKTISRQLSLARLIGRLVCALLLMVHAASAQTTKFTYQGRLPDTNQFADGIYAMQFALFDDGVEGHQAGSTLTLDGLGSNPPPVKVTGGVFTVQLDFGADAFPGADRYVEVAIKYPGDAKFTPLRPRQQVTSKPYAIRSLSAASADTATLADTAANAKRFGGMAPAQYVQTDDPRLSDERTPAPDSPNYIQNTMSPQAGSFNINGDGTVGGILSANVVNATTQLNLGGGVVLRAPGTNLFAGFGAGEVNSNGTDNSFFGLHAGGGNTSGQRNSFFGVATGQGNISGSHNSFFGAMAGLSNVAGSYNSFFGTTAGQYTTGGNNSFFGYQAGFGTGAADGNSFFGVDAGGSNRLGSNNSFFGTDTGGETNSAGNFNTLIGSNASVGSDHLNHATAIGADSVVSTNNTVVLGRSGDTARVPGNFVSIGTITATTLGGGGLTTLCRNISNQISHCSSSLRYKTNIAAFSSGLSLVSRLRPISFDWKAGGPRDVGFGAEEVAAIDPLFVTYNAEGQVEGVKYDRLSVAFVNAFQEQQTQIEQQRDQIKNRQKQIEALKKLVCLDHPKARVCK